MKLLAWIDRVDRCSQRMEPRPPFEDESGGYIFPPEDHEDGKWWLTEMSLRQEREKQAQAEDLEEGAASDETNEDELVDEKDVNRLTSDEESEGNDRTSDLKAIGQGNSVEPLAKSKKQSSRASWTRSSSSLCLGGGGRDHGAPAAKSSSTGPAGRGVCEV